MAKSDREKAFEAVFPEGVVSKLKAEHGDVFLLLVPGFKNLAGKEQPPSGVAFRAPEPMEVTEFTDSILEDSKKKKAVQVLARSCIVFPGETELDAVLEKRPGLLLSVGKKVSEVAGIVDDLEMGKA